MKNTQLASSIFTAADRRRLAPLAGGELAIPVADLAALALIPWYCDVSVQWGLRLALPGHALKHSLIEKVNDSFVSATRDGRVLIGVPGDGIAPSTYTLFPLAKAIAEVVQPGMIVELATANLGRVKRDWSVKSPTTGRCGDHRYVGTIDAKRRLVITRATPALTRAALATALDCARPVITNGPWPVKSKAEARSVLIEWVASPTANIAARAVGDAMTLEGKRLVNGEPNMNRNLYGLGLGFFRHRLAGGPFTWTEPYEGSRSLGEAVAKAVLD